MSDLPSYSDYKESGVEWLGRIPSHWMIKRLKYVIRNISDKVNAKESELRYLGLENIESFTGKLINSVELESEGVGHEFQKNDVLFGKLRPYLAKVYLAEERGLSSTEALIFRASEKIHPKFLSYYCLSQDFINEVNGTTFGSKMPRASWDDVSSFSVCFPEIQEQKAITRYLDKKLAQIDTLITKQQALLEKLAEQRIALISNAVTKGLNPDVEMKESEVEWLGKIPSHWDIWKIVHTTDYIGSGTTPKIDNNEYYDGDTLWVTTSELRETLIEDTKQHVSELAITTYSALKKYPKNSVAIAMYGATIGRLGILGKEATFNQACCVFCCSNILDYKFLYYWLWMRRPILVSLSNGGGQPNLSQDDLKKIRLPLPPKNEQQMIVRYLEKEITNTDVLQDKINKIITNLKEYRSALITQAVTGKIDVRNLAN